MVRKGNAPAPCMGCLALPCAPRCAPGSGQLPLCGGRVSALCSSWSSVCVTSDWPLYELALALHCAGACSMQQCILRHGICGRGTDACLGGTRWRGRIASPAPRTCAIFAASPSIAALDADSNLVYQPYSFGSCSHFPACVHRLCALDPSHPGGNCASTSPSSLHTGCCAGARAGVRTGAQPDGLHPLHRPSVCRLRCAKCAAEQRLQYILHSRRATLVTPCSLPILASIAWT